MIIAAESVKGSHYRSAVERARNEEILAIPGNIPGIYATTRAADGLAIYTTDARIASLGCTCMAGETGKICKHIAAAALDFGTSPEIARRAVA